MKEDNEDEEMNEGIENDKGKYTDVENDFFNEDNTESINEQDKKKQGNQKQEKEIINKIPINLLFIGDPGVGKSNIIRIYCGSKENENISKNHQKSIRLGEDIIIELSTFEISGSSKEEEIQSELAKLDNSEKIDQAIIVFSVHEKEDKYLKTIKKYFDILKDKYPISIVGNKDLPSSQNEEEVKKKIENNFPGINYYRVNDNKGLNISLMFENIFTKLIEEPEGDDIQKKLNNENKVSYENGIKQSLEVGQESNQESNKKNLCACCSSF